MARLIEIHPTNPQPRRVASIVQTIHAGGLIAYPTDSSYALRLSSRRQAGDGPNTRRIRKTDRNHNFTLVCSDLSEISTYALVDNWAYRMMKSMTPWALHVHPEGNPRGAQTPAEPQASHHRNARARSRPLVRAVLDTLGEPIMSSTLTLPGDDLPLTDPAGDRGAHRPRRRPHHRCRADGHSAYERYRPVRAAASRSPAGGPGRRQRPELILARAQEFAGSRPDLS